MARINMKATEELERNYKRVIDYIGVSSRNWPEDFGQENGCYGNMCSYCNRPFIGNKHRFMCKECHSFFSYGPESGIT